MSIRARIFLGFALIALAGAAWGGVALTLREQFVNQAEEQHKLQTESSAFAEMISAHRSWKSNLIESVMNMTAFPGSLDPYTCFYGSWLKGEVAQNIDDAEVLRLMDEVFGPHERAHLDALAIVQYIDRGNREAAKRELDAHIIPYLDETISLYSQIVERYTVLMAETKENSDKLANASFALTMTFIALHFIIVVFLFMSVLFSKSISSSRQPPIP